MKKGAWMFLLLVIAFFAVTACSSQPAPKSQVQAGQSQQPAEHKPQSPAEVAQALVLGTPEQEGQKFEQVQSQMGDMGEKVNNWSMQEILEILKGTRAASNADFAVIYTGIFCALVEQEEKSAKEAIGSSPEEFRNNLLLDVLKLRIIWGFFGYTNLSNRSKDLQANEDLYAPTVKKYYLSLVADSIKYISASDSAVASQARALLIKNINDRLDRKKDPTKLFAARMRVVGDGMGLYCTK